MIDKGHVQLSIIKQCKVLDISRSGLYYKPRGTFDLNLELMRRIDEHYLEHPEKGVRRMHLWLTKDLGYDVRLNRIENLYYNKMAVILIKRGKES